MAFDLEQIRSRNPIEEIVAEKFALKKSGTRFIGVEHDSLVVVPNTGWYFWNSRNEQGDVFDFVGRHILSSGAWNNRSPEQFVEAGNYLAQRVGIPIETSADVRQSPAWSERQLVQRLHDTLLNTPSALNYVTQQRGWQLSTVKAARIGYLPQDKRALLADLNLSDSWRSVIQKFPPGMIVYVHTVSGRLSYLSGRSIQGKKHYNPPREIIGERQPYYNHFYDPKVEQIVIVEGQADAITFGEWGVPALALGGMKLSDTLLNSLRDFRRVFVALDNTEDAQEQCRVIAQALGRRAYLPKLLAGVKDANEWLAKHRATAEDANKMLNYASRWIMAEIERASQLEGIEQEDALRDLFRYADDLDEFTLARFKSMMAKQGIRGRTFIDLVKAGKTHENKAHEGDEMSEVFGDDIPVLSPAQGFRNDLALVTVSLRERTQSNKLIVQPYLVTSTRELIRLKDQQILKINRREVALRVIPEGSEFLMRWRYRWAMPNGSVISSSGCN